MYTRRTLIAAMAMMVWLLAGCGAAAEEGPTQVPPKDCETEAVMAVNIQVQGLSREGAQPVQEDGTVIVTADISTADGSTVENAVVYADVASGANKDWEVATIGPDPVRYGFVLSAQLGDIIKVGAFEPPDGDGMWGCATTGWREFPTVVVE